MSVVIFEILMFIGIFCIRNVGVKFTIIFFWNKGRGGWIFGFFGLYNVCGKLLGANL